MDDVRTGSSWSRPAGAARRAPAPVYRRLRRRRLTRRLTRRGLLQAAGRAGIGAAGLALVGCGGDDAEADAAAADADPETDPAGEAAAGAAGGRAGTDSPQPRIESALGTPQSGGVLRLHASLTELDFFDIHRSRFPLTQRFSALQQSRLLRYADSNSGTLEGDLVAEWETPDEESYVLLLRAGVRWWQRAPTEGRAFSGEDIRRNIERQIAGVDEAGDPDAGFLRRSQYERTASVDLVDSDTVVLRTDGPVGTYFASVIAGPWSFLQAPEAWEAFGDRLRDEPFNAAFYTGTGAFQMQRFIPEGIAAFQRNTDYVRPQRPLLDAIEFAHLPDAASQEAAYRNGDIDIWSPGDPSAIDSVLADQPGDQVAEHPLPFPLQIAMSSQGGEQNPLRDRRLALALHRGLDREAILNRVYAGHAGLSGPAPWFAAGWADGDLRERPGYRAQPTAAALSEIRTLASVAADLPSLPLTVPDLFEQSFPGLAAQIAGQLSERLGIPVRPGVDRYTRIVEGLRSGAVPLFLGWGPAARDADPTLDLQDTMHSAGVGNWGGFSDPAIDAAIEQMAGGIDRADRQRIFRETLQPLLLETPAWVQNIGHGVQRSVHRADVWLPRFGFAWDGHHFERAWRT